MVAGTTVATSHGCWNNRGNKDKAHEQCNNFVCHLFLNQQCWIFPLMIIFLCGGFERGKDNHYLINEEWLSNTFRNKKEWLSIVLSEA
jgi:hypothetical protein